jgi:D-alanyl-D-alanine carboxypeptidase
MSLALLVAVTVTGISDSAMARNKYASLIIDAETGTVLHARNADSRRHPASLTKIMTLYMLFEALEEGRLSPTSKLKVSARAAGQPPSKLGLRKGGTITVRNAIRALVTKSANDVATVVSEALGGTEYKFALKMTDKARALGMRRTTFRNASGLHHPRQITTARDMATLAIAIRRDFPGYFHLFSTTSFQYGGRNYGNHNKLLSRYSGTDGIKTGYINASGFNLVATVERNGRRLIGVVFGGRTGSRRDNHMIKLLNTGFSKASKLKVASLLPPVPELRPATILAKAQNGNLGGNQPLPDRGQPGAIQPENSQVVMASILPTADAPAEELEAGSVDDHSDWGVQVGAYSTELRAKRSVTAAKGHLPRLLGESETRVEILERRSGMIFRARLFGLTEDEARDACLHLKRRNLPCVPVPGSMDLRNLSGPAEPKKAG